MSCSLLAANFCSPISALSWTSRCLYFGEPTQVFSSEGVGYGSRSPAAPLTLRERQIPPSRFPQAQCCIREPGRFLPAVTGVASTPSASPAFPAKVLAVAPSGEGDGVADMPSGAAGVGYYYPQPHHTPHRHTRHTRPRNRRTRHYHDSTWHHERCAKSRYSWCYYVSCVQNVCTCAQCK